MQHGDDFVEITCHDVSKFKRWSSTAVATNIAMLGVARDRLASGAMTRARYDALERSVGFAYNPHGLWTDAEILQHVDLIEAVTVDWVHNTLQDGTFTVEACIKASHAQPFPFSLLGNFTVQLAQWTVSHAPPVRKPEVSSVCNSWVSLHRTCGCSC